MNESEKRICSRLDCRKENCIHIRIIDHVINIILPQIGDYLIANKTEINDAGDSLELGLNGVCHAIVFLTLSGICRLTDTEVKAQKVVERVRRSIHESIDEIFDANQDVSLKSFFNKKNYN